MEFIPVNLTSIVHAYVDLENHPYWIFELLSGLSSVKSLDITNDTLACLIDHTEVDLNLLPTFNNLTHLYVYNFTNESTTTSGVLPDILRKTPKLEVLHIPTVVREYLDGEDSLLNSLPCCLKSSLNRLCILYFSGDEDEIKFVRLFLKNAPLLGKIELFCGRSLLANVEKVADIQDQLQSVRPRACVIEFFHCFSPGDNESPVDEYEDESDDESDEDEAANSGVFPAAGVMQESSSGGSAASPNRSEHPDIDEMWQLWTSEQHEQIVQEEVQQAFEAIRVSRLSTMVDEVLHQQKLMPPPSYNQQQILPPFPPHYDQLQIPRMQESSSAVSVSAASTGQSQQPDIEEMWRLWKSKYDHIVQEKVQQAVRAIIESTVRKVADEVPHQPMLMPPAADAASLSTSLLSSADVASISTSLLPTAVLAASSVPASITSLPSPVSVSTPVSASSLLPAVLAASSVPVSSASLSSSVSVSTPVSATTVLPARDD